MIPRRIARALLCLVALVIAQLVAPIELAHAQSTPDVTLKIDTDDVEVGDPITITLSAMSDAGAAAASDPTLKVPTSFKLTGPMVSTQSQVSIVNGHISQRAGMRATWQAVPTKEGQFDLGPVQITVGGKKMGGGKAHVTVRPRGAGARPRQRSPLDPFSQMFPFGGLPDLDDAKPEPQDAPVDPQLGMDAPTEPQAFLRAIVDKTTATVGEQVTLSIYLYAQARVYQLLDPHEPTAADFYERNLSGGENDLKSVPIGGTRWSVQLVRRIALFPLKAGKLAIGPMTLTLVGPGLRGAGMRGGIVRESKSLTMQVNDPPAAGRPAGYALGDVGSYSLSATVDPRAVEAGGSIGVTVMLKGTGNVPTAVRLPEVKNVDWLEPEVRESIDTTGTIVTGSRTFSYVVKMSAPGAIDLGAVTLPYFDPKSHSYQTASASLGVVQVVGSAPAPVASAARDPFAAVGAPRASLGAYTPAKRPLTDGPWLWLFLAGAPLSVLGLEGLTRGLRAARSARVERRESAATKIADALAEAEAAEQQKDGKKAASAVERAVVLSVDEATGLKIRGLLREEVAGALERVGLPAPDAAEVVGILNACDAWRFLPGESPAESDHPARRVAELAKRLSKWKKP